MQYFDTQELMWKGWVAHKASSLIYFSSSILSFNDSFKLFKSITLTPNLLALQDAFSTTGPTALLVALLSFNTYSVVSSAAINISTTVTDQDPSSPPEYTINGVAYFDPTVNGGSLLDNATSVIGGLGEPINAIISGLSSPKVLTSSGFLDYSRAIGFSDECFGLHLGGKQQANLGDGNGWHNQTLLYREHYGNYEFGTCLETLIGGNHFRMWRQDGPDANSGALFLAVSQEKDLDNGHMIVPDGYNVGRDKLVQYATAAPRKFRQTTFTTAVAYIDGLLPAGSNGVNHGIGQDGRVALLTVTAT